MTQRTDKNPRQLKRAVQRNSYTVDPQRVAGALIVRLIQESVAPKPPATGGPSHATDATGRLRQAA